MKEGITSVATEEEIAEFLINEGYPGNVEPLSCVLSGSRAYGIHTEESDRDYVGIHLMDTWECLEHPDYREPLQVIRKRFHKENGELSEVPPGIKGGDISLDSFEVWKFISMLEKGSFVVYEILYLPEIHHDSGVTELVSMMRGALNNKIGKAAKGNAYHDWRKDKTNRKKTILAYYRLLQAIYFLREEEFEWLADSLWEYARPSGFVEVGQDVLNEYRALETRKNSIDGRTIDRVSLEIEKLVEEVDRAMVVTRFPDYSPKDALNEILERVKRARGLMI